MRWVLVLCAIVVCPASAVTDRDSAMTMRVNLLLLKSCIAAFHRDLGRLPTAEEGLYGLIHKPKDWPEGIRWESYLNIVEVPTDGWGKEFVYVLDASLLDGFGIYSCGEDGVTSSGGNDLDDINTWNRHRPWLSYYRARRGRDWARAILVYLLILAGVILILWETSRIENHLKRRRAINS